MKARFTRAGKSFRLALAAATYQETAVELKEVVLRTPVEHGDLRRSEHIEGPTWEGDRVYCLIVAGGPAAPYAIYVHENDDAIHPVGQSHFISSVLEESAPFMGRRILKRIRLDSLEV